VVGDHKGSQFTATTETYVDRNYVELVQMVSRPLLTPVQNKSTSISIFHNTKCNWDLIVTIQDLIMKWRKWIAFRFHWVKGDAYLIERLLTRDEILNIEEDLQADTVQAQARGPIAT
jgi:hypothetical protein